MKSILVTLNEYLHHASPAETGVIRYLQENAERLPELSIQALSQKSHASTSTVLRLCRKIGFHGYKDFRQALLCELAVRKNAVGNEKADINPKDDLEDIVDKVTYRNIVSLENTKNLLDINILEKCLDLVSNSRLVGLYGIGASLVVAKDAYLKLLRLNKLCAFNEDWHSQLVQAHNMTTKDVAIVVSYSGRTQEMVDCVKILRTQGCPIIAITRYDVSSPIAGLSTYNLYLAVNESLFRSGAMSSRISQLNIIDILHTALANRDYENSLLQLKKTHLGTLDMG